MPTRSARRNLAGFAGDICPYELVMHAAKNADVIILNYHHLFDREIRDQLYANLNVEEQDVMLLIDEAHNCGDVIQSDRERRARPEGS